MLNPIQCLPKVPTLCCDARMYTVLLTPRPDTVPSPLGRCTSNVPLSPSLEIWAVSLTDWLRPLTPMSNLIVILTDGYDDSAAGAFWISRRTCGPASVTPPPPLPARTAPTPLAKTATVAAPCRTKPLIRMLTACHIRTDGTREVTHVDLSGRERKVAAWPS